MKNQELDIVLMELQKGMITQKQAINRISTFINKNYPVFGLHKYDEDFRSDLILSFLEKGEHIISLYNPQAGDFFTFLYCYITTLANSKRKVLAKKSISEKVAMEELKKNADEVSLKYKNINYSLFDMPKAPYAYKPVPAEELKNALKELSVRNKDKKILVLALKASFYLTDYQIEKVCSIYKLDKNIFYQLIQLCKESIYKKAEKRRKIQIRRSSAYYRHKRYKTIIEKLNQDEEKIENSILIARLSQKEIKCQRQWEKLNISFKEGLLKLRPTNRTVADLLGICERQVSYYINSARKEMEKNNKESKYNE